MSLKRKYEEYHDPDYPQPQTPVTKHPKQYTTAEERCEKIRLIVRREFEKELTQKEEELQQIDEKLQKSKRLLQRVRYAVVANFYRNKNLEYSERELQQQLRSRNSSTDTQQSTTIQNTDGSKTIQTAIHPSLKKLLGKRPIDYDEILKIRPARQAAKTAKTTISEKLRSKKDERKLKPPEAVTISEDAQTKVPRYVSPIKTEQNFAKLTSARGRNIFRHLLAVGNTSKYIGDEKSLDGVTHKWLVYVKTKSNDIDIAQIVSEVRFFLHPSYQPNDVVKVDFPPFQLSRRGWGEFPIRLQLFFHSHIQQKPLQIIHNLVLDKRLTGLQTMGAETIVEVYLNVPNTPEQHAHNENNKISETTNEKQDHVVMKHIFKNEPPLDLPATMLEEHKSSDSLEINHNHEASTNICQNNMVSIPVNISVENIKKEKIDFDVEPLLENNAKTVIEQTPIVNVTKKPATSNIQPQKKIMPNLVKCLDSNGKVIIVQLVADPNNPKNIKIIKNPKLNLQTIQSTSNTIKIANSTVVSSQINSPTNILPTIASASSNNKIVHISNQLPNSVNEVVKLPNVVVSPTGSGARPNVVKINQPICSGVKSTPPTINQASTTVVKNVFDQHQRQQSNTTNTSTNNKTIIMKNGNIFIVQNINSSNNSIRPAIQQKTKLKQESLLKPQISLLKTNLNKPTQSYLQTSNKVPSILGREPIQFSKNKPIIASTSQLPPQSYQKRLETQFYQRNTFSTVKLAVTWLLKHIPLFNQLPINDVNFESEFPFVCQSKKSFMCLTNIQQKCNEWYRAKYIQRLCKKHKKFENVADKMWTTKEILLFARRLGHTPAFIENDANQCDNIELKTIIQSEIKREQLNSDTVTLRTMVTDWLTKMENITVATQYHNDHDDDDNLVINIDECDDNKIRKSNANICVEQQMPRNNMQWLRIDDNISKESTWVSDICRDIQIYLAPEEICKGVMHSSAQRLLVQALHSFLEDLLRQSFFYKTDSKSVDNIVRSEDIRKAISKIRLFDFCTNQHLGVKSINQ